MLPLPPVKRPLPLPPKPTAHEDDWLLEKAAFNKARLVIDATLTRSECFRLVGQLERLAAAL